MQTRLSSFIEAWINVAIGFAINFAANMLILPLIGFHITAGQNLFIGLLYTIISVARSYAVRRWFNSRIHAAAEKLQGRRGDGDAGCGTDETAAGQVHASLSLERLLLPRLDHA